MNGRFLLFIGRDYESAGGADDIHGRFDSIEAAYAALPLDRPYAWDWAHVYDLEADEVAARWFSTYLAPGPVVWQPLS